MKKITSNINKNLALAIAFAGLVFSLRADIINRWSKVGPLGKTKVYEKPMDIALELWNKTNAPIRFKVTKIKNNSTTAEGVEKLDPEGIFFLGKSKLDLSSPTYIHFYDGANQLKKTYYINPGKNIYVRIKTEKNKDVFGPQTGALKGIVGSTDTGLSTKGNVTSKDIQEITPQGILAIDINRLPDTIDKVDAYKIAGLQSWAKPEEIKRKFDSLLKRWDPNNNPKDVPFAKRVYAFIVRAKDILLKNNPA